jgi:hypothetical protein
MSSLNLWDLMELYARRGVADWTRAPFGLQRRARECLMATQIATRDADALNTIRTIYDGTNSNALSFIPMPMPNPKKQPIERCFFLPIREKKGGVETFALELLVLVKEKKCLAFRFEPADRPSSRHGYGHLQMNQKMLKKTIPVEGVPEWMPDKYPAFPMSTSDPLKMFLAMATAVHGYADRGFADLIVDIFQQSSRAADSTAYLAELRRFLAGTMGQGVEPGWKGLKTMLNAFGQWATQTIKRKRR